MTDDQLALVAKALAHPARVKIVSLLAPQTECAGHEVFSELPLAQSTISQHLRVLRRAGLIESHPVGTSMVYCLVSSVLDDFHRAIGEIAEGATGCAPAHADCPPKPQGDAL